MTASPTLGSAAVPEPDETDHLRGEGPIAILYFDLACPRCAGLWSQIVELPLRLCVRHFPVSSKRPRSPALHAAAEAVARQSGRAPSGRSGIRCSATAPTPTTRISGGGSRTSAWTSSGSRPTGARTEVEERVRRDFRSGIRAGVAATPSAFASGRADRRRPRRRPAGARLKAPPRGTRRIAASVTSRRINQSESFGSSPRGSQIPAPSTEATAPEGKTNTHDYV